MVWSSHRRSALRCWPSSGSRATDRDSELVVVSGEVEVNSEAVATEEDSGVDLSVVEVDERVDRSEVEEVGKEAAAVARALACERFTPRPDLG